MPCKAKWLTILTSNLRIANRKGSNPVRSKPLFPLARKFTLSTGWVQEQIREYFYKYRKIEHPKESPKTTHLQMVQARYTRKLTALYKTK